jgi:prepilin-type processing-associated H-X9-DG protein
MSVLLTALLASSSVAYAVPQDEIVILEASALVAPCREEAEAYFVGQGLVTYQWSASHKSRGNALFVDGTLRVEGGRDVQVSCRLPRGARLGHMNLEIVEK